MPTPGYYKVEPGNPSVYRPKQQPSRKPAIRQAYGKASSSSARKQEAFDWEYRHRPDFWRAERLKEVTHETL